MGLEPNFRFIELTISTHYTWQLIDIKFADASGNELENLFSDLLPVLMGCTFEEETLIKENEVFLTLTAIQNQELVYAHQILPYYSGFGETRWISLIENTVAPNLKILKDSVAKGIKSGVIRFQFIQVPNSTPLWLSQNLTTVQN